MNKNQQPDRAPEQDFDAGEVPSVRGSDIYARAGRVAPQEIVPNQPPKEPFSEDVAVGDPAIAQQNQPTEVFAAQEHQPASGRDQVLASDAPTTAFDTPSKQKAKEVVSDLLPPLPAVQPVAPAEANATASSLLASTPTNQPAGYATTAAAVPQLADVQGSDATTAFAATPAVQPDFAEGDTEFSAAEADEVDAPVETRRGTIDLGLLVLRLGIGTVLTLHAIAVFFKLFGSTGLVGLEEHFAEYNYPSLLAIAIPALELTAGVFLILGLMAPFAAAIAIVATSFTALHSLFGSDGSTDAIVLSFLMVMSAIAVQFTGPGRISLDFGRSWARRPLASSWILLLVALVAAGALWWFGTGINPLTFGQMPF